jgi:aminobenzoyl-glutamate utilization protein B
MSRAAAGLLLAIPLAAQLHVTERPRVVAAMTAMAPRYGELSRKLWELAEVGYKETQSAQLLMQDLRANGFRVQDNIGGIPTAFIGTWGQGRPVVGILGEYDALPGLSQDTVAVRRPFRNGSAGHACGHNLLSAGAAMAAVAVKNHMNDRRLAGTIRFVGTPAEEGGAGKVYLARAGAFDGLDVALMWHPSSNSRADLSSGLAINGGRFRFRGQPAHAAAAPWLGRSALDGAVLMAHAVDMLREHMVPEARVHYIFSNGGAAPNVVPEDAELQLYARHPRMSQLDGIWDRIRKSSLGAALATETVASVDIEHSSWEVLPNDTLAGLIDKNLRFVGGVKYTAEEAAFAESLRRTDGMFPASQGEHESILPPLTSSSVSTDLGDVSWIVPSAQFAAASWVPGTSAHSWQATACSGASVGRKGMELGAKVLALVALDLVYEPRLADQAKVVFERRKAGVVYRSRIPEGRKAPLNYRDR